MLMLNELKIQYFIRTFESSIILYALGTIMDKL